MRQANFQNTLTPGIYQASVTVNSITTGGELGVYGYPLGTYPTNIITSPGTYYGEFNLDLGIINGGTNPQSSSPVALSNA